MIPSECDSIVATFLTPPEKFIKDEALKDEALALTSLMMTHHGRDQKKTIIEGAELE